MTPSSNQSKPFQRGWVGFGYNYFQNLGYELYQEIPKEALADDTDAKVNANNNVNDPYTWGISESSINNNNNNNDSSHGGKEKQEQIHSQHCSSKPLKDYQIQAYQYTKEIPAKPKKAVTDGQIAPAACSSAATIFLSGERHNRIITRGTIHGRVMDPAQDTAPSGGSTQQKPWTLSPSTVTIPLPLPCVELAAGRHFCLARMEGGLAVCSWGAGHFGQLGHGASFGPDADGNNTSTFQATPKVIERLLPRVAGSPMVQIAAGDWHGSAVTAQGVVLSGGCNRNLQCGRKSANKNKTAASAPLQMIPMPVTIIDHELENPEAPIHITKMSCGKAHNVAISSEHRVYCWGASHYGQCAANSGSYRTTKYTRNTMTLPRFVKALKDVKIVDVAAGDRHTLALTQGGRVFSWGAGAEGQLGIFPPVVCTPKPRLIQDLDFVAIAASEFNQKQQQQQSASAGEASIDAYTSEGGSTESHALSTVPTITSIYASACCSYSISSSGHVYAWGSNDAGTLGLPLPQQNKLPYYEVGVAPPQPTSASRLVEVRTFDSDHNVLLPRRVDTLCDLTVEQIMAGPAHAWYLAEKRTTEESKSAPVGHTLHEIQEARRKQGVNPGVQLSASMSALSSMSEPSVHASSPNSAGGGGGEGNAGNTVVSRNSTLPTDEEDEVTEVGLASSMASLSYDVEPVENDGVTPQPSYPNNSQPHRTRASRRHSEPGNGGKNRNFSLRNLLSRIGSSRRNMHASTTQLTSPSDEMDASNPTNNSGHDRKSGKGLFRRRSQNGK